MQDRETPISEKVDPFAPEFGSGRMPATTSTQMKRNRDLRDAGNRTFAAVGDNCFELGRMSRQVCRGLEHDRGAEVRTFPSKSVRVRTLLEPGIALGSGGRPISHPACSATRRFKRVGMISARIRDHSAMLAPAQKGRR